MKLNAVYVREGCTGSSSIGYFCLEDSKRNFRHNWFADPIRSCGNWMIKKRKRIKEKLKAFSYDSLYINDRAHLEDYRLVEEVFRNKMLSLNLWPKI